MVEKDSGNPLSPQNHLKALGLGNTHTCVCSINPGSVNTLVCFILGWSTKKVIMCYEVLTPNYTDRGCFWNIGLPLHWKWWCLVHFRVVKLLWVWFTQNVVAHSWLLFLAGMVPSFWTFWFTILDTPIDTEMARKMLGTFVLVEVYQLKSWWKYLIVHPFKDRKDPLNLRMCWELQGTT